MTLRERRAAALKTMISAWSSHERAGGPYGDYARERLPLWRGELRELRAGGHDRTYHLRNAPTLPPLQGPGLTIDHP